MRLTAIYLRHVGVFRDGVSVGPFADGLSILAAPNESGKSTLMTAAARALFDRHTLSGDAAVRLQPVGTNLAPDIAVEFAAGGQAYRIRKRFVHHAVSELSESQGGQWRLVADGDRADERVIELLGGSRPGRGATRDIHWGLLRYLWGRQGEAAQWPTWDDDAGARIRRGLARIEVDETLEQVRVRLEEMYQRQFTPTGRVARQSLLYQAQARVERLETELQGVREALRRVEEEEQALRACAEVREVRRRERTEAESQAGRLTAEATEVDLLRKDLERWGAARDAARRRLSEVEQDRRGMAELEEACARLDQRVMDEERLETERRDQLQACRQGRVDALDRAGEAQARLIRSRDEEARLRALMEAVERQARLDALRSRWTAVEQLQERQEGLIRRRGALPAFSEAELRAWREQEQAARELASRAAARGLRVTIRPERDARIGVDRDQHAGEVDVEADRETILAAVSQIGLTLPGWGTIRIASGAHDAADLNRRLQATRALLASGLREAGIDSVEAGAAALERRKDVERELRAVEEQLATTLGEWATPEAVKAGIAEADAEATRRLRALGIGDPGSLPPPAALEADLARARAAVRTDEGAVSEAQAQVAERQRWMEQAEADHACAGRAAADRRGERAAMAAKLQALRDRYPDGIQAALEDAQQVYVQANAHHDVAQRRLPADWETLRARQQRAVAASAEADKDLREVERRAQRIEGALAQVGSEGLYSRETAMEESLELSRAEARRLERTARAARLAAAFIDHRKRAAIRTVLRPLEEQLSAAFVELTGVSDRRVFLDENLGVRGIGAAEDRCVAFDQLSQGGKEQLLLALRAAAALELARQEPQLLILDDVLVNTDPVRQQRVLDFLERVAREVQVLVLTCHPDRYRGSGRGVTWEAVASPGAPFADQDGAG